MAVANWNERVDEVVAAMKHASGGHFTRNLEDNEVRELACIAINTYSLILYKAEHGDPRASASSFERNQNPDAASEEARHG